MTGYGMSRVRAYATRFAEWNAISCVHKSQRERVLTARGAPLTRDGGGLKCYSTQ
jgi:hypothetical protein